MAHSFEYIRESLENALNDLGLTGALPADAISHIAGSLEGDLQNERHGSGRSAIPNPLESKIEDMKRIHAQEVAEHEGALRKLRAQHMVETTTSQNRIGELLDRLEAERDGK